MLIIKEVNSKTWGIYQLKKKEEIEWYSVLVQVWRKKGSFIGGSLNLNSILEDNFLLSMKIIIAYVFWRSELIVWNILSGYSNGSLPILMHMDTKLINYSIICIGKNYKQPIPIIGNW
jgi:hypothetical protein